MKLAADPEPARDPAPLIAPPEPEEAQAEEHEEEDDGMFTPDGFSVHYAVPEENEDEDEDHSSERTWTLPDEGAKLWPWRYAGTPEQQPGPEPPGAVAPWPALDPDVAEQSVTLSRQLEAEAEEAARTPPWPASLGIAKELALQAALELEAEANTKRGLAMLMGDEDEAEPEVSLWMHRALRCCLLCIYMPAIDRPLSNCIYMPAIDRSLSDCRYGG